MMMEMGENMQEICGLSVIRLFEIRLAMENTFIALDGVDWTVWNTLRSYHAN
jgi:hypothetical protein